MQKEFTNTLAKKYMRSLITTALFGIVTYVIILYFSSSLFWGIKSWQSVCALVCGLFVLSLIAIIEPLYFLLCGIQSCRCEKQAKFVINIEKKTIIYQNDKITEHFCSSDILEWHCYKVGLSPMAVYEIHLKSGIIIRHSSMIPFSYPFLSTRQKEFNIPLLETHLDKGLKEYKLLYIKECVSFSENR